MHRTSALTLLAAIVGLGQAPDAAVEYRIPVGGASLYARVIGRGRPVIVLHGGPDFDQAYLLPEFDRLADALRLVYYDQRGRGNSAAQVRPEDVSLESDVADIDRVRRYFQLGNPVLLGHSWGGVLALEYALRHPDSISALILMNPAPASARQVALLRAAYAEQLGPDLARQQEIRAGAGYQAGDPDAVTARYRIHFEHALARRADYDKLMARMAAQFHRQGSEGILKAWAIEKRLYQDTWDVPGYDLLPRLKDLRIPTLVISSEQDFIPPAIAAQIAHAIPHATLVTVKNCGHFSYMECGDQVRRALKSFFASQ